MNLSVSLGLVLTFLAGMALAAEPPPGASPLPWSPQYKIKPHEAARLTPADVVGPDGIVYPNWTRCGVQGGIPEARAFAALDRYGAQANDDRDDSEALERACEAAGQRGGGAVTLGQGTYYLDRPVTIRHDGVVIRGQGADKTKIHLSLRPAKVRYRIFLAATRKQGRAQ